MTKDTSPSGALGPSAIPLRQLIPNAVTVLALCAGLTGMRFALAERWEAAVGAVVLAGFLDAMDGRIARYLKGTSRFGAELDSLADVIAFGVSPAVIIYSWALHDIRGIGWIVALAHTVCCALRLARFNAQLDLQDHPHKRFGFNTGVPSPAGAGLTLTPLMLWIWLGPNDPSLEPPIAVTLFTLIWVGAVAALMVAPLATYSWKSIRLRRRYRIPALLAVALYGGLLFTEPMGTLCGTSLIYVSSIWLSQHRFRQQWRRSPAETGPAGDSSGAPVDEEGRTGNNTGDDKEEHGGRVETH
jgi:CDP-diacylglycerol---serine O-phosphatidyltransferase